MVISLIKFYLIPEPMTPPYLIISTNGVIDDIPLFSSNYRNIKYFLLFLCS